MHNPTMLYRSPGPNHIHGGWFETKVVDAKDVEAALTDGWARTTTEATQAEAAQKDKSIKDKAQLDAINQEAHDLSEDKRTDAASEKDAVIQRKKDLKELNETAGSASETFGIEDQAGFDAKATKHDFKKKG